MRSLSNLKFQNLEVSVSQWDLVVQGMIQAMCILIGLFMPGIFFKFKNYGQKMSR